MDQPPKPKAAKILYRADPKAFFQLGIVNLVFTVGTLGFYYPWAATDLRKYTVGKLLLNRKQPLEYTGTAKDMLRVVGPWWAGTVLAALALYWSMITQNFPLFFLMLAMLYVLIHGGLFTGRKYRLNNTGIKGVKFTLDASLKDYMKLHLKRALMNIVTLGYAIPSSDVQRWSFIANRTRLGSAKVSFTGNPKNLRLVNLISFGIPLLLFIVLAMIGAPLMSGDATQSAEQAESAKSILEAIFYLVLISAIGGRAWYRAALRVERWRSLKLRSIRFKSTATGSDTFRHFAINCLILVATMGLGLPYVLHRNLWFKTRTLIIGGNLEDVIGA